MNKLTPIKFSFAVSFIISLAFLFVTFWIFFEYSGSSSAAKDALSSAGGYFGALATLGAALIAAYLYTDWKSPVFVSKLASEQKDIIALTRRMKRNVDAFMCFMKLKKPSALTGLNNGDEFSIEYQNLLNNLLDDIDDLAGLLKSYSFNFNEKNQNEKEHLNEISKSKESLLSIYEVFAEPNPILGYSDSYMQVKSKFDSDFFQPFFKEVLLSLPDKLSKYHATLIK